jgi:pyridoxamine 5'-phosphate oxidase
MKPNLADLRKSYDKGSLEISAVIDHPINLFEIWFKEAEQSDFIEEANAMTLSTLGKSGFPKSRVVLLKGFSEEGFVFFTNYESEKGQSMLHNPKVGITFFWPVLERQIIIKGNAEKISSARSDDYFNSRPRGSQLGALVSPQSSVIPNRQFLQDRLAALMDEYQNKPIPRPNNWGGIVVKPVQIEFWQGRPNRLHDRISCQLINKVWKTERLAP